MKYLHSIKLIAPAGFAVAMRNQQIKKCNGLAGLDSS